MAKKHKYKKNEETITTRSLCISKEKYLFKIARKTLEWGEVIYCEEELADLVMLELMNVK